MKINGKEFFTIREIAELTGKEYSTVKTALHRAGIKPLTTECLYDKSALDAIRKVPPKGRPRKPKAT